MHREISFCNSEKCLHRRGCKRWIHNHDFDENIILTMIDDSLCLDDNAEQSYSLLIRYKNSDGKSLNCS